MSCGNCGISQVTQGYDVDGGRGYKGHPGDKFNYKKHSQQLTKLVGEGRKEKCNKNSWCVRRVVRRKVEKEDVIG